MSDDNKNRYTNSRIKHILKSLPYAFMSLFTKRDSKLIIFCAMHCETFNSNSKFVFLHFLKNEPEYNVKFVINNDELREKLIQEYGNHFIDTRTKEGKKIAIKAGVWVNSWLDSPIGGFFLNFRRLVIHLGHGTPLKCIGLCENDATLLKKIYYKINNTNITYSLASSDFVAEIVSKCIGFSTKRVLVSGYPRTDPLFETPLEVPEITKNTFNILYAPTWRHYSEVKLFPFADYDAIKLEDFLVSNNIKIFIRFHPAFEESLPKEILQIKNIELFSASKFDEVMDYINCFDSLITDYSSIYLDYMLLERPIMFLPYDLKEYEKNIGFSMDYNENTPGPKPTTLKDFCDSLYEIKNQPEKFISEIKELNKKLNSPSHNASKDLGDFIKNYGEK